MRQVIVLLGLFAAVLQTRCAAEQSAAVRPHEQSRTAKTYTICEAIQSAANLLKDHKMDWGEPRQVLLTDSNLYRVEYGNERCILVNREDGHAEFPLRR